MAGRLKHFTRQWDKLSITTTTKAHIRGYKIPFYKKPQQYNTSVALKKDTAEIIDAVKELTKLKVVQRCKPVKNQFISPCFLVKKPNGNNRFILNLKNLNTFIDPPHFKMEDSRTVMKLIKKDCYMATIDLKDAYFLIPVHNRFRKYLRYQINNQLYEFTCLPFGLCTAPSVFTKIIKPVLSYLRVRGVMCVAYLDDFWVMGKTKEECQFSVDLTIKTLQTLGFVINDDKSAIVPSQQCKFLGFIFNSYNMTIELTGEKRQKIFNCVSNIQNKQQIQIRRFAQFLGLLVSACPAVKYAKLYTKSFETIKYLALKNANQNYNKNMSLSDSIKTDLRWWTDNILTAKNEIRQDNFAIEIFSDASKQGGALTFRETAPMVGGLN